jgi:hypothetical protein
MAIEIGPGRKIGDGSHLPSLIKYQLKFVPRSCFGNIIKGKVCQ